MCLSSRYHIARKNPKQGASLAQKKKKAIPLSHFSVRAFRSHRGKQAHTHRVQFERAHNTNLDRLKESQGRPQVRSLSSSSSSFLPREMIVSVCVCVSVLGRKWLEIPRRS